MRHPTKLALAALLALLATLLTPPLVGQAAGQTGAPNPGSPEAHNPPGTLQDNNAMGNESGGQLRSIDRSFVLDAARGGLEEVELGKLAASKATHPDVKSFGQKMVDDHSKANDQLKSVASQKGISLPTDLDRKAKSEYNQLDKLSGDEFDRAYVKLMVKDHDKDVSEFRRVSKRATSDPVIRQFASSALPTLEDHLTMAKDLQSKVEGGSSSSKAPGTQRR
jgi:putative membrane protein